MQGERFDRIARGFAGTVSRRRAIANLAGWAGAASVAADGGAQDVDEERRRRCRRPEKKGKVRRAIRDASRRYNQKYKSMLCVADCESTLNNCAVDPSGSYYGLFQFVPSTFDSTPFGRKDIFDPKWNALAAGWMWKEGRQNEWTCCNKSYGCKCPRR